MKTIQITDGYKLGHINQYPKGTQMVYSNLTPRKSRKEGYDEVVFYGLQYFIMKYLIEYFNENFFSQPIEKVVSKYESRIKSYLGEQYSESQHIRNLHSLGYLPLEIRALPEGCSVPIGVPMLTIKNTLDDFYWLTNYIETLMSCTLWQMCTSATIAKKYKSIIDLYLTETSDLDWFADWQCHDFSMRGMSSLETASMSGSAHLLSFKGTDTLPAIDFLEDYYQAELYDVIGGSVPATEHSVMCMGTEVGELETYRRLITETYPSGIVSIVSDTWDFWNVIGKTLPSLKSEIMGRNGKVVIRPDSGDPILIICGDEESKNELERKGLVECLWDTFGGEVNSKGYKQLSDKIGCIYGDSITTERAEEILKRLKKKGFASSNIVFGVGSFTYQYNTRDTFGFAIKATMGKVNNELRAIQKDPKTGDGHKKSLKGFISVEKKEGKYIALDEQESDELGEMKIVFKNGKMKNELKLSEIRENISK